MHAGNNAAGKDTKEREVLSASVTHRRMRLVLHQPGGENVVETISKISAFEYRLAVGFCFPNYARCPPSPDESVIDGTTLRYPGTEVADWLVRRTAAGAKGSAVYGHSPLLLRPASVFT